MTYELSKLGQTDMLGGLCMQDYKSVCTFVIICATLVNKQTHRQHLTGYSFLTFIYSIFVQL